MNSHIAQIRQVLAEGRRFWGGQVFIDEERLYTTTVAVRKSLQPGAHSKLSTLQILTSLGRIESLVENSKCRFIGRVLIRPADFEPHLQVLEAALNAPPPLEISPSSTEFTIETAKLEAARIIEEAHREADNIRRRAREAR